MFEGIETLRMARAMTDHAARRQTIVARNIANADTPGFKASDLQPFESSYSRQPQSQPLHVTRAGHLGDPFWSAGKPQLLVEEGSASPNGNTVSIEDELVRTAEIRREHEIALGVYRSGLDMLRTSIGRRT